MRGSRSQSRLIVRRRQRGAGCGSYLLLFGLIAGAAALTWTWLNRTQPVPLTAADNRLGAAFNAFMRGDLTNAISLSRQVVEDGDEKAVDVYAAAVNLLTRALIYRSYSDYNRAADRSAALNIASEAHVISPSNFEITAAYALALAVNGYPGDAAAQAENVLERRPEHTLARTALALAYSTAGSHEIALRESQHAVESAEGLSAVDALRALAIAYSNNGNYEAAIRAVDAAIAAQNSLIPLHFERALYALQTGDADDATVAYFQVLTLDPSNVKARFRLCELSSMLREHLTALRYCSEVTDLAPGWADGWYQLGREYFLQGDFANAQENLHRCAALQTMQNVPVAERRFECWYLQGQAAQIRGDCEALLSTYNEFRAMAADADVQETWVYPPEGPPGCAVNGAANKYRH
ncbi:MAG: hypothetical protein IAE89_16810 [Anaerolineae bacterium]|nr:hypothetical protein [Anaerolineae bacterium]